MASLPKPLPDQPFLSLDELEIIYGTPEYEAEIGRQARALAEHNRRNGYRDYEEPDWESLNKVWQ